MEVRGQDRWGAKYQYNNRLLEERKRGWRREGGERSLKRLEWEGMEAAKRNGGVGLVGGLQTPR